MEKIKIESFVKELNSKLNKKAKIKIIDRREKINLWKKELKKQNKDNFFMVYNLLNKIFDEEKLIDRDYTVRQLAIDTEMDEQYVYKILKFRYANENMKSAVISGKINYSIALRILSGEKSRREQNSVLDYVINNNVTNDELDKYLVTFNLKTVKQLRQTKDKGNTLRDFFLYSDKLLSILPLLNDTNFHICKKVEIKRKLVEIVDEINKVKLFR